MRTVTQGLFGLAMLLMVIYGLNQTEQAQRAEGVRVLREGLLRAAVTCYAVEGSYPQSVAYLEERYGVLVDHTKYIVEYNAFSENIMPVITVMEVTR